MIVDDEPRILDSVRMNLELEGYQVFEATNGQEALDAVRLRLPDLVVMDVMMPQMDGYETTRAIRQMPQFASLPVIAVTARAMQGDRDKSIDAGATDYITKPIDMEELLDCMERWLNPASRRITGP